MESIIFETLPPPTTWSDEKIEKWCTDVCSLLKQEEVATVNIPEIVEETREQTRSVQFVPKIDNMHFASLMKQNYQSINLFPNKICVRLSKNQFQEWVDHAHHMGIRQLILVGGENSKIAYPGYSLLEATAYVKQRYPEIKVGGITIFTRKNEAQRLLQKMQAGMDFFFSQIVFEASNMKQIVSNLEKLCRGKNLHMPQIYVSLAMASHRRDIEFMKWLGVEFPTAVHSYLTEENEVNMVDRTVEVIDSMLNDIFSFIEKEKIDVGFNVEHLMYNNLHLSEKLFKNIKERIR